MNGEEKSLTVVAMKRDLASGLNAVTLMEGHAKDIDALARFLVRTGWEKK